MRTDYNGLHPSDTQRRTLAEANLVPLSLRAKQLAAEETQRPIRLPDADPIKAILTKTTTPRLRYRADEAWKRACDEARADGRPPPKPPDEDAVMTHKPCLRRTAHWMAEGAGIANAAVEPMAEYHCRPPWETDAGFIRFVVELPTSTRKSDPPQARREAAQQAIDLLPPADVVI